MPANFRWAEPGRPKTRLTVPVQVMKCLEMYNQVLHMQQKGAVAEAVGLYEQLLRMDALKGEVDPVRRAIYV